MCTVGQQQSGYAAIMNTDSCLDGRETNLFSCKVLFNHRDGDLPHVNMNTKVVYGDHTCQIGVHP